MPAIDADDSVSRANRPTPSVSAGNRLYPSHATTPIANAQPIPMRATRALSAVAKSPPKATPATSPKTMPGSNPLSRLTTTARATTSRLRGWNSNFGVASGWVRRTSRITAIQPTPTSIANDTRIDNSARHPAASSPNPGSTNAEMTPATRTPPAASGHPANETRRADDGFDAPRRLRHHARAAAFARSAAELKSWVGNAISKTRTTVPAAAHNRLGAVIASAAVGSVLSTLGSSMPR
ncbi:hypothetical protein BH09ACT4_BH09ACT4_24450 [soil metagenome]